MFSFKSIDNVSKKLKSLQFTDNEIRKIINNKFFDPSKFNVNSVRFAQIIGLTNEKISDFSSNYFERSIQYLLQYYNIFLRLGFTDPDIYILIINNPKVLETSFEILEEKIKHYLEYGINKSQLKIAIQDNIQILFLDKNKFSNLGDIFENKKISKKIYFDLLSNDAYFYSSSISVIEKNLDELLEVLSLEDTINIIISCSRLITVNEEKANKIGSTKDRILVCESFGLINYILTTPMYAYQNIHKIYARACYLTSVGKNVSSIVFKSEKDWLKSNNISTEDIIIQFPFVKEEYNHKRKTL